jgi:quinol monooxygenase YgiN
MGLILRTELAVRPGQEAAFEDVARTWVARTATEEATLGFHLFFDRPGLRAIFLEHYRDSAGFEEHAAAVDPELRTALYATCAFTGLDVYGDASPAVRDKLSAAGAQFFGHVASA